MESNKLPKCKLIGTDGNVFAIIGTVCNTLRTAKQPEKATEFRMQAMECKSYSDVLILCGKYVDIH